MQQQLDSGTQYICPLSICVPSFNLQGLTVPQKSVTKIVMVENLRERKMKQLRDE